MRATAVGLGLVLMLALSGCASDIQDMGLTQTAPSRLVRDCANSGGTLATTGKHGRLVCAHPTADSGKH